MNRSQPFQLVFIDKKEKKSNMEVVLKLYKNDRCQISLQHGIFKVNFDSKPFSVSCKTPHVKITLYEENSEHLLIKFQPWKESQHFNSNASFCDKGMEPQRCKIPVGTETDHERTETGSRVSWVPAPVIISNS